MQKAILLSLLFGSVLPANAQSFKKAERAASNIEYEKSIEEYKKILQKDSNNYQANYELGSLLCQYVNNPAQAGPYLLKAEKQSKKDTASEIIYHLAQYYQAVAQYPQATAYYKRTLNLITEDEAGAKLKNSINRNIESCTYAQNNPISEKGKKINVSNVGKGVNGLYPDYVPVPAGNDSTLFFTSRRKTNAKTGVDNKDGNYFEDMFVSVKKDGKYQEAQPFPGTDKKLKNISNIDKDHEAVIGISYDGSKFYTYQKNKIYESDMQSGVWTAPKELSDIDLNVYQNHVTTTKDGKTMYFSAEQAVGNTKLDIYKAEKQADGSWGKAVSLSSDINTTEDENSPLISEDGKTLYFASTGHSGYGGYDFFKTTLENGTWSSPVNMGMPFNSSGDDVYLTLNASETKGFMSSSRAGGYGDMDVYEITYKRKPFEDYKIDPQNRIAFSAPDTVYVGEEVTFAIKETTVPLQKISQINWLVNNTILDSSNNRKINQNFTKAGTYNIKVEAQNASSGDFYGYEKNVVVIEKPSHLATNTFGLTPLYFAFDKSRLNTEAYHTLEKNIQILQAHPDAIIEIAAYCDARGSIAYNQILSEKRAKAVVRALKKKGFDVKRVKQVQWFGKKDPVNKCNDGVPCTEEEYKLNRRAEFRLSK
ncbi:MAG: OmpA family protein [Bacteroidetes bacterium]|nr:OmpA family protein [Bacteroidota bacterium]